jgi:hypothetical protein
MLNAPRPFPHNGSRHDILDTIRDVHSCSLARSAMSVKQVLARSLLRPGSFVVPMLTSVISSHRPTVARDQLKRLQWFLLHPIARKFITGAARSAGGERVGGSETASATQILEQLAVCAGKLEIASRLDHTLSCSAVKGGGQVRLAALARLKDLRDLRPKRQPGRERELLLQFLDPTWRWLFSCSTHTHPSDDDPGADWTAGTVAPRITSNLRQVLNQLIVAIGEFPLEHATSNEEELGVLSAVIERSLFPPGEALGLLHPASSSGDGGSTDSVASWSTDPQFRRDLVAGLLLESSRVDVPTPATHTNATFVAGILYSLILPIVSISEAEWFVLWRKWCREQRGQGRLDPKLKESDEPAWTQELFDLFRCGVLQLQYLGLVRERRTSHVNGKTMYEKPVLVWCGGD